MVVLTYAGTGRDGSFVGDILAGMGWFSVFQVPGRRVVFIFDAPGRAGFCFFMWYRDGSVFIFSPTTTAGTGRFLFFHGRLRFSRRRHDRWFY